MHLGLIDFSRELDLVKLDKHTVIDKLIETLKSIGIDHADLRIISKLY